jgi:hypothetical protein
MKWKVTGKEFSQVNYSDILLENLKSTPCFHQRSLNNKKTGGVLPGGRSPPPGNFQNKGNRSPSQ